MSKAATARKARTSGASVQALQGRLAATAAAAAMRRWACQLRASRRSQDASIAAMTTTVSRRATQAPRISRPGSGRIHLM